MFWKAELLGKKVFVCFAVLHAVSITFIMLLDPTHLKSILTVQLITSGKAPPHI